MKYFETSAKTGENVKSVRTNTNIPPSKDDSGKSIFLRKIYVP